METYDSKDAIYEAGYHIAFKFVLDRICLYPDDYVQVRDQLQQFCQATLTPLSQPVKNYETEGPPSVSVGFFVDFVDTENKDPEGHRNTVRTILLQHEDGAEIFFMLTVDDVIKLFQTASVIWKVVTFMKKQWPNLFQIERTPPPITLPPRTPPTIKCVEIRTKRKGVMQIKLEHFQKSQVDCLIRKFPEIDDLQDCNDECFGGYLKAPQASD